MTDTELKATLGEIQRTLAALTERVEALEARLTAGIDDVAVAGSRRGSMEAALDMATGGTPTTVDDGATTAAGRRPTASDETAIAPEILLAISAAVAAYLGERAHVRQVRLISSQEWGRQGRVTVQASHALHR